MAPPMSFKKRPSLRESLDHILTLDEEAAAQYRAHTMKQLEAWHEEAQATWSEHNKTCYKCQDDDDLEVAQQVRKQHQSSPLASTPG